MLTTACKRLLALENQGTSAADAVARKPLAELEDDRGGGIFSAAEWIGLVYPAVY